MPLGDLLTERSPFNDYSTQMQRLKKRAVEGEEEKTVLFIFLP